MRKLRRPRSAAAAAAVGILGMAVAGCSSGGGGHSHHHHSSKTTPAAAATPVPSVSAVSPPPTAAAVAACATTGSTMVSSASALKSALSSAHPGQTIGLAARVYPGDFTASHAGTASAPITLCGSRGAVLQGDSVKKGYTFYLDHASWWRVEGFTVQGGQKGGVAAGAAHYLLDGLYVHGNVDEGIHLRSFSRYDVISHCVVRDTGRLDSSFGEGLYVGSAHKNWCRYSGCQPDGSDHHTPTGNNIRS